MEKSINSICTFNCFQCNNFLLKLVKSHIRQEVIGYYLVKVT